MNRGRLEGFAQRAFDAARNRRRDRLRVGIRSGHDEHQHCLALERIRNADGGGLGGVGAVESRGLHLRRAHPLARDLDGVIGATQDVPEPILVDLRPVAVDPDVGPA